MELRQLEAFAAVAAELHFGHAAEKLHIGPPTLSDLISRLERELGSPLFTRTTRRVALTSTGILRKLLYQLSPTDPWTFSVVVACIITVGLAACFFPARKASQVDPLITLRYE